MTQPSYLRYPHLHGDLITFTAEDDVWAASLTGAGRAWRVSSDNMPVRRPRISPDGRHIAYTTTRDGAPENVVVPVDGGAARRLTHWGVGRNAVSTWTPDGDVVVVSSRGEASAQRSWAYALPVGGGPALRLPYGWVGDVAYGPGGAVLTCSVPGIREAAAWKRYRGGGAGKLWLDPDGGGEFHRVLAGLDGNLECPMWVGERLAFLSDHEGTGALYSCLPDGDDLRRHSALGGFYARHAATDGERVVFTAAGRLHLVESLDAGPDAARVLEIRLGGQVTDRQPYPVRAAAHFGDASPDHTGRGSAVEVRGTIHWVTHRDGPARALAVTPGVRTRLPRVFRKGGTGETQVVWVTDAEGDDALEIGASTGVTAPAAPRRMAAGQLGRVHAMTVSPDGRRVAVAAHDGRVLLVDTDSGEVRTVCADGDDGDASGLVFSPDSGWLAWSQPGPGGLRNLRIANVATLAVADATPLRFTDHSPAFTADGKHLAFLSERAFDPVYDAHVFDLSFPNACRPHLITLAADTPSPFGPQRAGRSLGRGDDDGHDGDKQPKASGADGEGDDKRTPVTRVDVEGLADRIVPFPVEAGRYSTLRTAGTGVLWLRHPLTGVLGDSLASPQDRAPVSVLQRYDLARLRSEELAEDVADFRVTGDGERLALLYDARLRIVPSDSKSSDDDDGDGSVTVDLSRVRLTVDPAAEWRQMYEETGRLMRDNFWRADMNGVDWDGVLDRYRPVLDGVATHDDLVDLLWEVHGELGTSHAYVLPPGAYHDVARRQGLLGADIARDPDGLWRVERVLPSETSDPHARSPLAAPGVAVRSGDAITAVDGRPVEELTGPAPLLVGTAGKPVELTVLPSSGEPRAVVVVPLASEEALRYHDWVAGRRAHVRQASGGRLGYLHVPDMMGAGWAQLHRDLRVELGREGVVLDVRENRGGHTSQLVVEKLARRLISWDYPRDGTPTAYPADAPRGPVVAVADEFAGSDGDIVNGAFQALGIGPVVGTRTWGGVIGIDSRYALVDGTLITQPKFATWMEGCGWGMENHGIDPDVEVVITPQDRVHGRDPQLDTAIRLALEALEATPARTPPPLPPVPGGDRTQD
ncbi:S41 family peptidase [Streptantibioticus silvisoli]|uniref:Tricorn protease homolog n=1 Tax=Streptantibioticus silvisoli TaxID=2705255 RepID=A0ABT6VSI8_9ACTN|nr:S41 family peptidase [Streptantibioticus silvisoli]MDI5961434.1 PDZ domain-containing protein [Streptantibioticus silvisoli]